jgi:cobalt-zinc-cadmium efflux system outer membrane protein
LEVSVVRTLFIRTLLFGLVVWCTSVSAQTPQPPAQAWTLDAVVAAALAQHPLVEAARARLTAAEGARQTAGNVANPLATYWFENLSASDRGSAVLDRESSIYGTLPLEPLFQRGPRIAQAQGDVRAARASASTAEQRVAADAVHAFFRAAVAQASLEAMRDNLAAIDQVVEYLRNRVAQGAAPEGDLIRIQVERDRVDAEVTMADVELIRAQAALRPFLGDGARADGLRVTAPDWSRERVTLAPLSELTTHALAQRADLVSSRAKADAAAGALALERAMVVRQLGASFGVKRSAGVNSMMGGISFTVPVFDRNRGAITRATAEQLAAQLETRWMERVITSEVDAEYQVVERLSARLVALRSSFLGRAEESRRIAVGTYQEGATTLLQVLDASRALSDARVTYARLLAATNESLFDLAIAAGYDPRTAARLGRGPAAAAPTPDPGKHL